MVWAIWTGAPSFGLDKTRLFSAVNDERPRSSSAARTGRVAGPRTVRLDIWRLPVGDRERIEAAIRSPESTGSGVIPATLLAYLTPSSQFDGGAGLLPSSETFQVKTSSVITVGDWTINAITNGQSNAVPLTLE